MPSETRKRPVLKLPVILTVCYGVWSLSVHCKVSKPVNLTCSSTEVVTVTYEIKLRMR